MTPDQIKQKAEEKYPELPNKVYTHNRKLRAAYIAGATDMAEENQRLRDMLCKCVALLERMEAPDKYDDVIQDQYVHEAKQLLNK